MIRLIPIIHYKAEENRTVAEKSFTFTSTECSVCLNEFHEKEKLRIIPNCSHVFHIDCIDVWLQNNANCPLCRTSISLSSRFHIDQILNSRLSPQRENLNGGDEDFVVIELSNDVTTQERENTPREMVRRSPSPRKKAWKLQKVTSMGDECIDIRGKDEKFSVQPIRRSFSMDSSGDRQLYMAVQEALKKQNRQEVSEVSLSSMEGCSSSSGNINGSARVKRSFFSFGHSSSRSRSSVLPVSMDH